MVRIKIKLKYLKLCIDCFIMKRAHTYYFLIWNLYEVAKYSMTKCYHNYKTCLLCHLKGMIF